MLGKWDKENDEYEEIWSIREMMPFWSCCACSQVARNGSNISRNSQRRRDELNGRDSAVALNGRLAVQSELKGTSWGPTSKRSKKNRNHLCKDRSSCCICSLIVPIGIHHDHSVYGGQDRERYEEKRWVERLDGSAAVRALLPTRSDTTVSDIVAASTSTA